MQCLFVSTSLRVSILDLDVSLSTRITVRSPQIYLLLKSEKSILDNVGDIMVSNIYGRTHRYTLFRNAHTIQDWLEYWYSLGK